MKTFSFLILLFAIGGCEKNSGDDLSGSAAISGKLYIQNPYDSNAKKPVTGHEIFLRKDITETATSFLFSNISDKDGYFTFNYLYDTAYKLHADSIAPTRIDASGVLYSIDTILKPTKNIELVLTPDVKKQNALYIICTDGAADPGLIPEDSIYIYTAEGLADNDNNGLLTGEGASYKFIAGINGTAFKMNVPFDRPLFINACRKLTNKKFKSGVSWRKKAKQFGVDTITLELKEY